eukprot:XP_011675839.1 PREDICTED: uncharacterized protein LOC105443875 [Strongylocentrotus purpuratus]
MLSDLCRGTGVVRHGKIEVVADGSSGENTPVYQQTTGPGAWPVRPTPKKALPKTANGGFTFKQKWNLAYGSTETLPIRPLGIPRETSPPESLKKAKSVNDVKFSAMWSHYMSTSSESSSTPSSQGSFSSPSCPPASSVSLDDVSGPWADENDNEWTHIKWKAIIQAISDS